MLTQKIEEFLNDYLLVEKNCSPKTVSSYRVDLEQFADFLSKVGIEEIGEITKPRIREFLAMLMAQGKQITTRNRKLTTIRSFCNYLCAEDYIPHNPSSGIDYGKTEKKIPVVMSMEKTSQVIDSAHNLRDKAALETLYGTGVRVEELVNIEVSNIEFDTALIRVLGKGGKWRIVPTSGTAIEAISEYLKNRDIKSKYLFPSPVNLARPISQRSMYDVVRKYGEACGVKISPHKFRHSVATHLLSNGMDIREIQEFLGHANINTTTIYTKVEVKQMSKGFHRAHPRG